MFIYSLYLSLALFSKDVNKARNVKAKADGQGQCKQEAEVIWQRLHRMTQHSAADSQVGFIVQGHSVHFVTDGRTERQTAAHR